MTAMQLMREEICNLQHWRIGSQRFRNAVKRKKKKINMNTETKVTFSFKNHFISICPFLTFYLPNLEWFMNFADTHACLPKHCTTNTNSPHAFSVSIVGKDDKWAGGFEEWFKCCIYLFQENKKQCSYVDGSCVALCPTYSVANRTLAVVKQSWFSNDKNELLTFTSSEVKRFLLELWNK